MAKSRKEIISAWISANHDYVLDYHKKYWDVHRDRYNSDSRKRLKERRLYVYSMLGNVCRICGEDEYEFLTIDHVDGGGGIERKTTHHKTLILNICNGRVDVSGYQLLCRNCNSGRSTDIQKSNETSSKHVVTNIYCLCGRLKIRRQSRYEFGIRNRIECPWCDRQRIQSLKARAVERLGGKCKCCSESDLSKLNIDHVHNDGFKNRRPRATAYKLILDSDVVEEYQILCWNCNYSKHLGNGTCIHKRTEVIDGI